MYIREKEVEGGRLLLEGLFLLEVLVLEEEAAASFFSSDDFSINDTGFGIT